MPSAQTTSGSDMWEGHCEGEQMNTMTSAAISAKATRVTKLRTLGYAGAYYDGRMRGIDSGSISTPTFFASLQ